MNDTEKIAREFGRLLTEELGESTIHVINDANGSEPNENICHSHDYCDANMVMSQAMANILRTGVEIDPSDPAIVAQWNAAWKMAVENDFYIMEGSL